MPTPEDRSFFEGLNSDLAKGINKAIEGGFKGASLSLDAETVKLIGVEFSHAIKPLEKAIKEDDDGGGGGGSGSAGQKGALNKVVGVAKGVFGAARQLVAQNASNILAYGDTMARGVAATNQSFLMNGDNLATKFGHFGFDIQQTGAMLDSAMRANVKGLGKNTQNFLARSAGLGISTATNTKFLSANTNILGQSMKETASLGTDLVNMALSNGMIGDSIFAAVAAFEANTKAQQVIFGAGIATEFQKIVGGLATLVPGGGMNALIAKAAPTTVRGLLDLDILGGMFGGAFNSEGIRDDPRRHTANFIAALSRASEKIAGMTVRSGAQYIEHRFGKFGITLADIQTATVAMNEAGSISGLMKAMKGGSIPIKTDKELFMSIAQNSLAAANAMKNAAIELGGLGTVQKGLAELAGTIEGSFYTLEGSISKLAIAMGDAAAVEAGLQSADKLGLGGIKDFITSLVTAGVLLKGGRGAWPMLKKLGRKPPPPPRLPTPPSIPGGRPPLVLDHKTGKMVPQRTPTPWPTPLRAPQMPTPTTAPWYKRLFTGSSKSATVGATKKIPVAGAALGAVFEYGENQDISRAVTVGASEALGFWGGAAAGGSAGLAFGPYAPIASPVLALLGGLSAAWGAGEVGKVVHDSIDTDFVKKQELDREEAAKVEKDAAKAQSSIREEELAKNATAQLEVEESQVTVLEGMAVSLTLATDLLKDLAGVPKSRESNTPFGTRMGDFGGVGSTQRG
tara:strand:- start:301 stop:2517 length:2217 start_codon:yes stop_codon:yes gene_type:complete